MVRLVSLVAVTGALTAGCSFLRNISTQPIVRDSKTVQMSRPRAGKPIEGGRMVLWNLGRGMREAYNVVSIQSPADTDRRDNTIAIDSYDGKKLCFRVEDHVAGGGGNPYEVSPVHLQTSEGLDLTEAARDREDKEMVTVNFVGRNQYGVAVDDTVSYDRYVTKLCFSSDKPIITDETSFVRLEVEPKTGSSAATGGEGCCKFTFAFTGGLASEESR